MTPMTFEQELQDVLNRHSRENASNTPDFVLAGFLIRCLEAWNEGVRQREQWYGRNPNRGPTGMTQAEVDLALKDPS